GEAAAGRVGLHVLAGKRAALSRPARAGRLDGGRRFPGCAFSSVRGRHRRASHSRGAMSALAEIRDAPGLDAYLAELEDLPARAAGDYLFARAFAELSATGDERAVEILANATLCLARGEAMQRRQRFDPDTTIDAYLERCTLKTGKLFEAACRLSGGPGAFGL